MAAEKVTQVPVVTIASTVVYLVNGNVNQPKPAIVHVVGDGSTVDLHQFLDYSGATILRRNVRHLDDPLHVESPHVLAQNGAYLTPKEFERRRQEEVNRAREVEHQRHLNQMRLQNDRIVRLAKDGFGVTQIAAQVGVSEGMVEEVLRTEKVQVAQAPKPQPAGV